MVIGDEGTRPASVAREVDDAERRPVHVVRVYEQSAFRRAVARTDGDRSPDAVAQACPAVERTVARVQNTGRTAVTHARVTDRGAVTVAGLADELGATRVVTDETLDTDRLAEAAPCPVTVVGAEPRWFLTE